MDFKTFLEELNWDQNKPKTEIIPDALKIKRRSPKRKRQIPVQRLPLGRGYNTEEPSIHKPDTFGEPAASPEDFATRKNSWQQKQIRQTFRPFGTKLSVRLMWLRDMENIMIESGRGNFLSLCLSKLFAAKKRPRIEDIELYKSRVFDSIDKNKQHQSILEIEKLAVEMLAGDGPEKYSDEDVQFLLNSLIEDKIVALDLDEARELFKILRTKYKFGDRQPQITFEVIRKMMKRVGNPIR